MKDRRSGNVWQTGHQITLVFNETTETFVCSTCTLHVEFDGTRWYHSGMWT